jgi:flagellar motor switch protein FliN/FliY
MAGKEEQTKSGAQKMSVDEFADYLDVPMHVTLEIGRRNMQVREILNLKPNSVVQIMKAAGENIDVYINGKLIAFGEILELDNKAGIRLTDFHVAN